MRLLSIIKKSSLQFRSLDVAETPRVSLHEVRRQIASAEGVIAHVLSQNRVGALVHNARCALIAGIAAASDKIVLLLQEGSAAQPIDYRDVVSYYGSADNLSTVVEPFVRQVVTRLQVTGGDQPARPEGLLQRLDLGELAAENEIVRLRSYFVETAQFNDARRGNARLLTGRKGAGKTAIFYAVRDSLPHGHSTLVLDLKPEGYQFLELREVVLNKVSAGFQAHTLTAFWQYLLLTEIAQRICDYDYTWAHRDDVRGANFDRIVEVHGRQPSAVAGDFSERLLRLVDVLTTRFKKAKVAELASGGQLTETLFRGQIRELEDALVPYLEEKEDVWILLDNLDKSWPTRGATNADILILRTLMDATRKLQQQLEQRGVGFHVLVCLRNDIYEHLVRETPDRGKDTAISIDWDDPELFREIVRQRIVASTQVEGSFAEVWGELFDTHVGAQDSFGYILERTLMRPRDLLTFLRRAVEIAVNRQHTRVLDEDVRVAEKAYSEDLLHSVRFELRDIFPAYTDLVDAFLRSPIELEPDLADLLLAEAAIPEDERPGVLEILVWFGFLGIKERGNADPKYSYDVRYHMEKLMAPLRRGHAAYIIHPAFRSALGC